MADKDLVKTNGSGELTLPKSVDAKQYGVDMQEEDLVMPRLQLVQPTSQREGAGKFYFSLTGELFEQVECVVFSNQRGRVMFDPDMTKQETLCGSGDRIVPSDRYQPPQAERCVECKFSKRGYQEEILISGRKVMKFCSETQALKCMFVDSLFPFIFVGRRTSLQPVNEFLSYMQYECVKTKSPLCCFPIRITSELVQKANQKYYIPKIEKLGHIEKSEFITMMNKYADHDVEKSFAAEEQGNDDTPF